MGEYFHEASLRVIKSPLIKDVRGKGLLIGIEMDKRYPAHEICLRIAEAWILTKETHQTVIRFAPPLIITEEQIDNAVKALAQVLHEVESELKEKQ